MADYPELRDTGLLHHRVFMRPRTPRFLLACAGVLLAARWPVALVLTLPYLSLVTPRRRNVVTAAAEAGRTAAFDAAALSGTIPGSVKYRTLLI